MFWMIRVYFCSVFVVEVFSLRALTWDHCHCSWEAWRAWTECSETCGGGIQNRSRRIWHDDNNECYNFEKCASIDEGLETRSCNTTCFDGGLFNLNNISLNGSRDCANDTTGACCTAVTCGPPSSIKHGSFTGDDFTYNHHVLYKCDKDYSMTHPTEANRTCTEHGQWSGNTPVCIYARSCDSNPCKNDATCLNILGDYHCTCRPELTGKQCQVEILPSDAGNRTTRVPRRKGELPPQKGKAGTTAEIVNIAVGVSVSIALLGLTVLGFFLVRAHLNKRINTRDYIDTELQTVSSVVTVQDKHDGFECRPI